MRLRKKIFLAFFITTLLFLVSLSGTIFYFYYHPSSIKPLIEKSISRSTRSSFTIEELSYSIKPLRIRAKGISFRPLENGPGLHLEILDLMADIAMGGPFGHRSLTFKDIKIHGFSASFFKEMSLSRILPKRESPSSFTRLLKGAIALFLFRDVKFQAAEIINGGITARLGEQTIQVSGILAKLNPDHRIRISCSIQMKWPSQKVLLTASDVHITTDQAISLVDPEIKGSLTAKKVAFESPNANIKSIDVEVKLTYDHNLKTLAFDPMDLHLMGLTLKKESGREHRPFNLYLKSQGLFNLRDRHLEVSQFHLDMNDILQLNGRLNSGFGPQGDLMLEGLNGSLSPQKLLPFLPDRIKGWVAPFHLAGRVGIKGDVQGLKHQQKWRWHYNLQARFNQNRFSYRTAQIRSNGKITGSIQAEGRFPDIKISARMKADETILSGKGVETKPFKASLSLSGKHPIYRIKRFAVHIPLAKVLVGKKDILVGDIQVQIRKGRLDGEKKSLFLPEIRLDSSLLKNLLFSLEVDGEHLILELEGKDVHLIESALALNLLPSTWQFSGRDSIQIRVLQKEKGDWSFTSKLGFQKFGFQNQDSSWLGEKISLEAKMDGELDLKRSRMTARTALEVTRGEILLDRFYLNLNSNRLFSSSEGRYDISNKSLQLSHLTLGLKDILTLDLNGTLEQKVLDRRFHLALNIPKTSLKPLFHHFILEPFKTEKPILAALNLGGTISADLKLTGKGEDWIVMGHSLWSDGEVSTGDKGFSFRGINLDLPLWYQSSVTSDESQVTSTKRDSSLVTRHSSLKGELSIQSIVLPLLPKQSLNMQLDARPNRLSIKSPTTIQVPGGEIQLGPVIFKDLFRSRPSIDTSLRLYSIDLHPLLSRLWSRSIQGTVKGKLDSIHFEGNTLSSRGEIRAETFGGEVILSDLGGTGMFTSAPSFKLNARWDNLSLAEMTTGTSFGKIEGVLKGHLRDLEIVYGQPQKFDLLLETVKKKGVPQKISVKALDNISRVGGGHSPFIGFAGAFASIFREFPYKKIGIHASLENDVFRINGTIREGEMEYLVKRGGFSGVNVVNQNPDNRIRFKDMVKRIKRITSSRSGPVVK